MVATDMKFASASSIGVWIRGIYIGSAQTNPLKRDSTNCFGPIVFSPLVLALSRWEPAKLLPSDCKAIGHPQVGLAGQGTAQKPEVHPCSRLRLPICRCEPPKLLALNFLVFGLMRFPCGKLGVLSSSRLGCSSLFRCEPAKLLPLNPRGFSRDDT